MASITKKTTGQEIPGSVERENVKLLILIPRLNLYLALNFIIIRYFYLLTKFH
jgi:hypothetical protein